MDFEFRSNYWSDPASKRAFVDFIEEIHNVNFDRWNEGGYWDELYHPFSYFDKSGKIVSNVCLYTIESIVAGERRNVAQVSGVGTRAEFRMKGLNKDLTNRAFDWAGDKKSFTFLFSDLEAIPFYKKMGFKPIDEYIETIDPPEIENKKGAIRLNTNNTTDLNKIKQYVTNREPVSNKFGVYNRDLLGFHVLYTMKNYIYELKELNCLVFAKKEKGILKIFDIVSKEIPTFFDFYPYFASPEVETVEFYFFTDKLGVNETSFKPYPGNDPMIMGNLPFDKMIFPFTCRA